mmetsp:Transcript_22497/g.25345  ORF Transcript_22497/g.25345 Transcript_22497/m.25345 type:complete len:94 (-) Transcript_22497:198-479(-)
MSCQVKSCQVMDYDGMDHRTDAYSVENPVIPGILDSFISPSLGAEKERRVYELSPQVGDEIRKGYFGIQGNCQVSSSYQIQNDIDFFQLSSSS